MAHNGYARSIRPVHTSADGDSIYALSVGNIAADCDMVGTLAADVMSEAILSAVKMLSLLMAIRSAKILLLYNSRMPLHSCCEMRVMQCMTYFFCASLQSCRRLYQMGD